MIRLTTLLFATCLAASVAAAGDLCGVTVRVADETGIPLSVPVRLFGPDEKLVIATESNRDGIAQFCDFGFGLHSILVGDDNCNSVMIRRVRFPFPEQYEFRVVLSRCANRGGYIGNACEAYIRVVLETGEPASGVEVAASGSSVKTDRYGRASLLVHMGKQLQLTLWGPEYETTGVPIDCGDRWRIEKQVLVKRRASKR